MTGTQRWMAALAAAAALGTGWYVSAQIQQGPPPPPPPGASQPDKPATLAELQAEVRELKQEVRKLRRELHERSGPPGMRERGGPRGEERGEGPGFGRGPEHDGPPGPPPWARERGGPRGGEERGEGRGFGRGPEREGPPGPPPWARGHGERDDRGMSERKGGRCEHGGRPPEGDRYRDRGERSGWDRGGDDRDWRRPMPPPPPPRWDDRGPEGDDRDWRPRHHRQVEADQLDDQRPTDL